MYRVDCQWMLNARMTAWLSDDCLTTATCCLCSRCQKITSSTVHPVVQIHMINLQDSKFTKRVAFNVKGSVRQLSKDCLTGVWKPLTNVGNPTSDNTTTVVLARLGYKLQAHNTLFLPNFVSFDILSLPYCTTNFSFYSFNLLLKFCINSLDSKVKNKLIIELVLKMFCYQDSLSWQNRRS